MSDRTADFVKGLLIGGVIGAIIGILYAPKSGKETREDIAKKADELLTKAKKEYEQAVEKSKYAYESAVRRIRALESSVKGRVSEAAEKAGELAEQGRETIQDSKSRLKKALDAGIEAYREEQEKTP